MEKVWNQPYRFYWKECSKLFSTYPRKHHITKSDWHRYNWPI